MYIKGKISHGLILWMVLFVIASACSVPPLSHDSLTDQIPYVVSAEPIDGILPSHGATLLVTFSVPMAADSVDTHSVMLITEASYAELSSETWDDLQESIVEQGSAVVLDTSLASDGLRLTLLPRTDLSPNTSYVLLVFPTALGEGNINLDQTAKDGSDRYFIGHYLVASAVDDNTSENTDSTDSAVADSSDTIITVETETATITPVQDETSVPSEEPITNTFDTNRIFVSEIVTDPQVDHDDSSGGDGIAFNGTDGDGTISSTDEYIEITNGTDNQIDISGWSLNMIDGTDVTQSLNSGFTLFFGSDGNLEEFKSGESLVLGNPSGMINNSITIDLFDEAGSQVDQVIVEDANATTHQDEAWTVDTESGIWESRAATPGWTDF